MQKDNPPSQDDKKDDLRKDYRDDPGGYEDKWGTPPDPGKEPPSSDPRGPGKAN